MSGCRASVAWLPALSVNSPCWRLQHLVDRSAFVFYRRLEIVGAHSAQVTVSARWIVEVLICTENWTPGVSFACKTTVALTAIS